MAILRKIKRILTEQFPAPAKVRLEDHDGVIGSISSECFKQMDPMDRQDLIHKVLAEHLTPEEMRKIQVIVGVTHKEYDLMAVD
jgi:acid stress-induced BolA-like protein IbaG/YrbA